jgi:hypothetical protein
MWSVRTRKSILATFNDRWEAEEWARTWRAVHGGMCFLARTEN